MSHRFLPEIVGFLKFAGFYPIDSVNKWLRSLLIFWRLILASTTIAYVSQAIIQLYFVEFVLAELSFSILNIGGYIGVVSTLFYFHYMRKENREIYEFMNANFKYSSENGVENRDVSKTCRISKIFAYYWLTQTYISGICNGAWPLLSTSKRELSLPGKYPYDTTKSPFYELTVSLQILTNISAVTLLISGNFPFPCICLHISAQFQLLSCDLKNLIFSTLLDLGIGLDEVKRYKSTYTFGENPELDRLLRTECFRKACERRLKRLIQFHNALLDFCRRLECLYSPFLVLKTITSIFFVIFTTFSLYNSNCESVFSCVGLAMYFSEALIEAFMYDFSGEMLLKAADDFQNGLFDCKWYVCGTKIRRDVLMMLNMCRKGPKLTIGKVYTLNLQIFNKIVDSAVSYLIVLYKVAGKK